MATKSNMFEILLSWLPSNHLHSSRLHLYKNYIYFFITYILSSLHPASYSIYQDTIQLILQLILIGINTFYGFYLWNLFVVFWLPA